MSAPLLRLENLSVAYRDAGGWAQALDAVSLDLVTGEKLAVIGESGSGKSTLARAIARLLPQDARVAGRIDWLGSPLRAGKDIGFVFQDPGSSLNPVLTIGEQVAEGAVAHLGLDWRAAREHARALLARVLLPEPDAMLRAYPHQLSGGQRQRVAIAAAIAARPRLLIADEATSALDTVVQAEIVALLKTLVAEDGMTLLFITHDMGVAAGLADRISVFQSARLVETGAARDVLERPVEAYTRTLVSTYLDLASPRLIAGGRA